MGLFSNLFKKDKSTYDMDYRVTPHGGVKSVESYWDKNGNPCSKDKARSIRFDEYDEDDSLLRSETRNFSR